jgi:hypothetical protein
MRCHSVFAACFRGECIRRQNLAFMGSRWQTLPVNCSEPLLRWCGLNLDPDKNRTLIEGEGKLSTGSSAFEALVVITEEGLQIAHECSQALLKLLAHSPDPRPSL